MLLGELCILNHLELVVEWDGHRKEIKLGIGYKSRRKWSGSWQVTETQAQLLEKDVGPGRHGPVGSCSYTQPGWVMVGENKKKKYRADFGYLGLFKTLNKIFQCMTGFVFSLTVKFTMCTFVSGMLTNIISRCILGKIIISISTSSSVTCQQSMCSVDLWLISSVAA